MPKLFLLLLILLPSGVLAQASAAGFDLSNYGVRVEPDQRLMAVLATIDMATTKGPDGSEVRSINTPLSESGEHFRRQLSVDQTSLNADLRSRISQFINQYKKRNPKATDAELIAPFISMSYVLSPAPDLADPIVTSDLPDSLLDVLDFAPLVREFYRRSGFREKLSDYVKAYRDRADGVLRTSSREMVSELLDYLHTKPEIFYTEKIKTRTPNGRSKRTVLEQTEIRDHERRFFIVPEMLAPVGTITFVNIKDDYFVILPAEKDVINTDVRRAFLQFVIDPLVLRHFKDIQLISDKVKSLLDERRKADPKISTDVFLTVTRSLIAAVDARQAEFLRGRIATSLAREKIVKMKTEVEKLAVSTELARYKQTLADETALALSEAYENGAVMSFYFADQLKGTEDSGFDIASSMREMIATFDPTKETDRLAQNAEARSRAVKARSERRTSNTAVLIPESPVTLGLLEIQKSIEAKDYAKANAELKDLAAENPDEPRIYYSIGRLASLEAESTDDPEEQSRKLLDAKVAYSNGVSSIKPTTDKALVSLTYIALARIYEFFDDPATAKALYDKAIGIGDVSGGGYREAMAAKQRLNAIP